MSAVLEKGQGGHPWGEAQGSQGQKQSSQHTPGPISLGETEALGFHGYRVLSQAGAVSQPRCAFGNCHTSGHISRLKRWGFGVQLLRFHTHS